MNTFDKFIEHYKLGYYEDTYVRTQGLLRAYNNFACLHGEELVTEDGLKGLIFRKAKELGQHVESGEKVSVTKGLGNYIIGFGPKEDY